MIYTEEDVRLGMHTAVLKQCKEVNHDDVSKRICERPYGHQGNHMSTNSWWTTRRGKTK
jgi:hypothetical protein